MKWMLAVLGAVSLALTGCGEEEATLRCTQDTDCLDTELCHPDVKVCVQKCEATSECPPSAYNCEALSATNTQKICKCSTSQLCNQDREEADLVCVTGSQVCAPKCAADTDCAAGQTCDTGTGMCMQATPPCTVGSCATGQVCDTAAGRCVDAPTCTGTSQGNCAYGRFCTSASKCQDAPLAAPTCENFSHNNYPAWTPATSTGPVIYSVQGVQYQQNSNYCQAPAPDAFIIRVNAYQPNNDWPSTRAGLSGFFYVTVGGQSFDVVNEPLLVPQTGYNRNPSNLKDAEFNIYLCRPANSTSIQVGFYFTGGNPVCQQVTR
jgi:Cys-rich repeat protein